MTLTISLLLGAAGCEQSHERRFAVTDSSGVEVVVNRLEPPQWTLAPMPALSLGRMEGGGPEEFYRVRHVELMADSGLAVVNSGTSEVRVFNPDGSFGGAYGRAGSGPQEFRALQWVRSYGDSLLTYDAGNDRLSVWTRSGLFGRSFRLEWFAGSLFPVDANPEEILAVTARYMTELPGSGLVVDTALVSLYDLRGHLKDSIARLPHNERVVHRQGDWQTTLGAPFSAAGQLVLGRDGFCYAFGPQPEVRCYGPQGDLRRLIRLSYGPRRVTPEDVDEFWHVRFGEDEGPRLDAYRRMREIMPFPTEYPAFAQLLVDDEGRIWARRYATPEDRTESWFVLDSGRLVGYLETPSGFRVMDVRGGLLAGVLRNDLEVEFVQVYEFGES
ncbi:MAG: hypothetical protein RJQ04_13805 [Longimicrobiales bacterium]